MLNFTRNLCQAPQIFLNFFTAVLTYHKTQQSQPHHRGAGERGGGRQSASIYEVKRERVIGLASEARLCARCRDSGGQVIAEPRQSQDRHVQVLSAAWLPLLRHAMPTRLGLGSL